MNAAPVSCGECRYFAPLPKVPGLYEKAAGDGTCRHSAPKATRPGPNNFPTVTRDAWCRVGELKGEARP